MTSQKETENQDDVVVIEQRDKRTHLYIAVAAILGLAFGGLAGASITAYKWQATYQQLENNYKKLVDEKSKLVAQVEKNTTTESEEYKKQLEKALANKEQDYQQQIEKQQQKLAQLEEKQKQLTAQLSSKDQQVDKLSASNQKLARQADVQAGVFERSREVFQRELKLKQELQALQTEREELIPKIKTLKKACDVYLAGTSWDAKSDACDRQDEANARLSQVDQMIEVHKMDLKQIKEITDQLGVE